MAGLLLGAGAVVGLGVGSFLNVVIWRVPRGESVVRPGSHCPACGCAIRPMDNVPVLSWLILRGRCRDCGAAISPQYVIVEVLTALLFALTVLRFGLSWETPAFLYLAAVGVALAVIDLRVRRLPNALTLPSYAVGLLLLSFAAAAHHEPGRMATAAASMAACYALFYTLMLVKPGGMGFGDVKLVGVLGLYLGYLGVGSVVLGIFLAFLFGGGMAVVLLIARRVGRKAAIPFGPALIGGTLVAVFAGTPLIHFYATHLLA